MRWNRNFQYVVLEHCGAGLEGGRCYVVDFLERETGVEPATSSLGSWHSTTELLPLTVKSAI
jgi:hypothetical protein